ncbi:putative NEDD8-activating enzyme E1 regulatory subunit-like isoform X1 [Capsicum annuum]|nr:putative NEDD8-activating enzyme E1 regulatory subunit-like isoform X1 [Capsicum annuum]
MREKNHVENLSLEWSESSADNSQTERDILDELRPHTNIKELKISSYRGTQFPNWLADHSFLKLVKLSLSYCKDCFSLPALGQLPCLKFLSIREMHRITEETEEFYCSPSSEKPFNSLEKLRFAEMPEWKQWHVLGNGEFPALQDLSIKDCPKLVGKFPKNLCSLTNLRISGCPELNLETPIQLSSLKWFEVDSSPKAGVVFDEAEVFTSQLEGMKQIEELDISDCNSLTSLPTGTLPSTLKTLRMYRSRKFKLKTSVGDMISNMFLEELALGGCDSISSPELVVPRARTLRVWCFQNLTRFLIPNGTETHMTSLIISECKKLKRLRERMQELLPSLNELRLPYCPEIDSFPDGGLPFSLQLLWIRDCEKLVNDRTEWRLQRLHSLRELYIRHSGSDDEIVGGEYWELPCSIRRLTTSNLKTLSSQVLKSLTSLESQIYLKFSHCWNKGFPPLFIYSCHQLQSLPESGFPSSLSKLTITDCPNLQSLAESALSSSLSKLAITDCPNLQSLPVKGMPSSLSELSICNCSLLKPLVEFDKGEYWPEIAYIPEIYIGHSSLNTLGRLYRINNHSAWNMVEFLNMAIQESCDAVKGFPLGFPTLQISTCLWNVGRGSLLLRCQGGRRSQAEATDVLAKEGVTELFNLVFAVLNPSILGIAGKIMNCQKLCNQKLNRYGTYGSNGTQRSHSVQRFASRLVSNDYQIVVGTKQLANR